MISGLTEKQVEEIGAILRTVPAIDAAIIFGSRAMGNFSPASDVDIALMGDTVSLQDQIHLSSLLNETASLLQFDVVRFTTITNQKLIEHIQKHGREIYRKKRTAAEVA